MGYHVATRDRRPAPSAIPPRPIMLVERTETDAEGNPRLVADAQASPGLGSVRVLSIFDTTPSLRRHVWRNNPHCVECGTRINSPDDAAFLMVPDSDAAVACRGVCYPRAVARFNPRFDRDGAIMREAELEGELERDLRLVPDDDTVGALL